MTARSQDAAPAGRRGPLDRPWLLLVLPPLFWAGNAVIGRAVAGEVPPIALAFWRWTVGMLVLLPFAWGALRADWPLLRRHWRMMLVLATLGVAAFNTFLYLGLETTTVLNAVMLQSAMPVLIALFGVPILGERVGPVQAGGIALSLAGAVWLITHGEPARALEAGFGRGDLWVLAAVVCYALYTVLVRLRPPVGQLTLLTATFALGALELLPLYLAETVSGRPLPVTPASLGAIAYVAVFASILAYFCFNRSVQLSGASRAGMAIHLVPVFGALLSILLLGEEPRAYHAIGMALIAAGIVVARRG
ncbi:MAG TPA: DMT family transporter [Azospirillaceae bacterium]|nr:DMT family transporter [Azospirillaceae bacterium]